MLDLHAFLDSNEASFYDTCVTTRDFYFMLGSAYVLWLNKKHLLLATSSCEGENKAAFIATIKCVWIMHLSVNLGVISTISQIALAIA